MYVQAVIEIQRRLPNARVLYVSATGATESSNLGYMQRLGLWGPGTAFESRHKFVNLLTMRGVGEWRAHQISPSPAGGQHSLSKFKVWRSYESLLMLQQHALDTLPTQFRQTAQL